MSLQKEKKDAIIQIRINSIKKDNLQKKANEAKKTLTKYILDSVFTNNNNVHTINKNVITIKSGCKNILSFLNEIKNTYFNTKNKYDTWTEIINRYISNEEFNEFIGEILK